MISCTEFIPLYSEFFKFLDKKGGHDAVVDYWIHISDNSIGDKTNPNSLAYKCERLGGFEGARAYWGHTLTEEACDMYEIVNPVERYRFNHLRHCPSKGMLNELSHVEPYYDYCGHCKVLYARVLEQYGVVYEEDHSNIDNAECWSFLYEKGNKPTRDVSIPTDDCIITDLKSEDNKYLHRDFHLSGDIALKYCGEKFGDEEVMAFLKDYANNFYAPQIEDFKKRGLTAVRQWLEKLYEVEEASEVLHTEQTEKRLTVTVDYSPVIAYMHTLNQEPSKYYIEETKTLYAAMAEAAGLGFELEYYRDDGAAKYRFFTR